MNSSNRFRSRCLAFASLFVFTLAGSAATAMDADDERTKSRTQTEGTGLRSTVDQKAVQGKWSVIWCEISGFVFPPEMISILADDRRYHPLLNLQFEGDSWLAVDHSTQKSKRLSSFRVNPPASPKEIDFVRPQGTLRGVYEFQGDVLTLCIDVNPDSERRPAKFSTEGGDTLICLKYKKRKERNADVPADQKDHRDGNPQKATAAAGHVETGAASKASSDSQKGKSFRQLTLSDKDIAIVRKLDDEKLAILEKTFQCERDVQEKMGHIISGNGPLMLAWFELHAANLQNVCGKFERWAQENPNRSLYRVVEQAMEESPRFYNLSKQNSTKYVEHLDHCLQIIKETRQKRNRSK